MTAVLGISTNLFGSTLHKTFGERIDALLWTEHSNGSAFIKQCPSRIAPNRLEVYGACDSSTETHKSWLQICLMFLFEIHHPRPHCISHVLGETTHSDLRNLNIQYLSKSLARAFTPRNSR